MDEKTILKEAEEIQKELENSRYLTKSSRKPFYIMIALILILLIVLMVIPYYNIKYNPSPKNIPSFEKVVPKNITIEEKNFSISKIEQYHLLYNPADPLIKQIADKISVQSCPSSTTCYAKAIFYFVRDNMEYVSDPTTYDYIKSARESLATGGGDCDDGTVLLANLLGAVGIRSSLIFVPGHVFLQIYLPEAPNKYKENDWINLDPTCKSCNFGEIPSKYKDVPRKIVNL